LSAVHGTSPVLTTVMVGVAAEGSEIVVPGMMKLRSGRPMVRAHAERSTKLAPRL
jgi:hypothetical protein